MYLFDLPIQLGQRMGRGIGFATGFRGTTGNTAYIIRQFGTALLLFGHVLADPAHQLHHLCRLLADGLYRLTSQVDVVHTGGHAVFHLLHVRHGKLYLTANGFDDGLDFTT